MREKKKNGKVFWDKEYSNAEHLALSMRHSEDLEKFTRWLTRESGKSVLNVTNSVLDLGSGNGRNLVWLSETFGMRGVGYDLSSTAVRNAEIYAQTHHLPLIYEARSIAGTFSISDASQTLVLDMMTSHVLNETERTFFFNEVLRVLKPGGYFFYKTFLLDEDIHAKRLLREYGTDEKNTYIHPKIGTAEHVISENDIETLFMPHFIVHKIYKSHRHKGKDAKRRSIVVYAQKPLF
ncbi:MAG TPA: class I SAM-dependent methyltransferase [Candidatus Paceibacterota bacterium]|nr:class I SAM-dependent methyltransferase [Candidatus Paceibacterota bacterium]